METRLTTEEEAAQAKIVKFREMGKLLFKSKNKEFSVYAGDIFEAKTVKGNKNLLVAIRVYPDEQGELWMFYLHGGNAKKVKLKEFVQACEAGDLELKKPIEIDVERLALCDIMFDGFCNRRTFEEAIDVTEEEMTSQILGGNEVPEEMLN
jgi:hypothetical protein